MFIYHYSLSADFPNHKIFAPRFTAEVTAAELLYALWVINTSGDDVALTFADELSVGDKVKLDGVVAAHSGLPYEENNFDRNGNPVYAPTFLSTSDQARLEGFSVSAEAGQTSILDVLVTSQMLVQGGQFWAMGAKLGDKAQFAVVDKDNVLGLHTQFGVPLGTPIELVRYVKNYLFPTADLWKDDIIMPTVAPVAPGLYLRLIYEAGATVGTRTAAVLYHWYIAAA